MSGVYYIIEHPRRGTFRLMDSDWRAGKRIEIPRFSPTGSRNDPAKAHQFYTLDAAIKMAVRIVEADGKHLGKLTIRRSPDFNRYCPVCKQWIRDFMQAHEGHSSDCPRRNQ